MQQESSAYQWPRIVFLVLMSLSAYWLSWGMLVDPTGTIGYQASIFFPAKEADVGFWSSKLPDITKPADMSDASIKYEQCVFQYGIFYGAFWNAMIALIFLVPGPRTERAVYLLCAIHVGIYSEAAWYLQSKYFEGGLGFVKPDLLEAVILFLFCLVPIKSASVSALNEPLLGA